MNDKPPATTPVVLVTGAARRIGAAIAREMHAAGYNVVLHYHGSAAEARRLAQALERERAGSAFAVRANLLELRDIEALARKACARWRRLDVLVNSASTYSRTPLGRLRPADFDDLIGTNLRAPLFLTQACVTKMKRGSVINIADISAAKPRVEYSVYTAAKAGLIAASRALALELAPRIRVNCIAPHAILWPVDHRRGNAARAAFVKALPARSLGDPGVVARAVRFLADPANAFIVGQVLTIDGGGSLV